MKQSISYCGLICSDCPIHMATFESDKDKQENMRAEIAIKCNELYDTKWNASDITDCDGCAIAGGRLFAGCISCKIRPCAFKKGISNCAYCDDYACETLQDFFINDPEAKERLDLIRNNNKDIRS